MKQKKKLKKPDLVADNPGLLPYATNVGAPRIFPDDIDNWKLQGVAKVNHQLNAKFEELKAEYVKLIEEYKWNDLVYRSKFSFEPVIGEKYHLYYNKKSEIFLSLIAPHEWNFNHIGSFLLNSERKWIKLDE